MHPAGGGLGRRTIRPRDKAGGEETDGRRVKRPLPASANRGSREGNDESVRRVVRPGDSLWSIAEEVLATEDLRRIARYWPKIHRANYQVVGKDPSLLFPGQVLVLPPETEESPDRRD
ncbi:MAG: LysM peptidoglycan-binding domain-containing protein [Actinomycetota bacterium]